MKRDELPTVGFLTDWFQVILAKVQHAPTTSAPGPVELLSIEQVMERTGVSRSTVQRWLKNGKRGRTGAVIKLQAYYFSLSEPRIPWPALAAFGQGQPFNLDTLKLGDPALMRVAS